MNEPKAIELCLRHRDPAGFEFLVAQYRREAFHHALGLMGNAEDAADACQDAFRRAFAAMPGLPALDRFYPWFYRILRNRCLQLLDRRRTARDYRDRVLRGRGPEPARESDSPAELAVRSEEQAAVWEALKLLRPEFREILTLKYFHGRSYEEMAGLLEIPRGTVMSRLYHARRALKQTLESAVKAGKELKP